MSIWSLWLTPILAFLLLLIGCLMLGNQDLFLYLHRDGGRLIDWIMRGISWSGDGTVYLPYILYIAYKRRNQMGYTILYLALSLLLTHFVKEVWGDVSRPCRIFHSEQLHQIDGYRMHGACSFPSGHMVTACSLAWVPLVFGERSPWYRMVGYPALVGYSRIYLGQHFPLDLVGSMGIVLMTGILVQQISVLRASQKE